MTLKVKTRLPIYFLILLMGFAVVSCTEMSIMIEDENAGFNGSFETTEDGIPVNWMIYAPQTVPDADFDISLDETDAYDGKVALHFDIRECVDTGGRYSPGIAKEIETIPGAWYSVRLMVKNDGSLFRVNVGGVSEHGGEMKTFATSDNTYNEWTLLAYDYYAPPEHQKLRFELSLLQPGQFWVDDISITPTPKID
jgi:hypothetical protein